MEDFKKDIDSHTLILGDFNTPLSIMNRYSTQNINKYISASNNAPQNGLNLFYIYKMFHPKEAKYTSFSNVHGTFLKTACMQGHKISFNIFKNMEIIESIFSDHKGRN